MNGQLAFDLDLDLAVTDWAPVWLPSAPPPGHAAAWKEWQKTHRCRDCGALIDTRSATRSCSGANSGGFFVLCDDCAAVDGLRLHTHHAHACDPRPAGISNWTAAAVCDDCTWDVWTEEFASELGLDRVPRAEQQIQHDIDVHNEPFWAGRWGIGRMSRDTADRLLIEQARRRMVYLRERAA